MKTFYEKVALGIIIPAASVVSVFITPEISLLQQHFSINVNSIGQIMSYYLSGYLVGQSLFAFISKKIGYKKSIQLGAILSLVALIIQIKAFNSTFFNLFLIGRFLTALGLSSGLVCGFAYLKDRLTGKEEKKFLSIITVVFTLSIYFSIILSGNIIKYLNLDCILSVNIIYILIILISSLLMKQNSINNTLSINENHVKTDIKTCFKLITYSFCLSISTIFAYCYAIYAPFFLIQYHHLTPTQFGNYNFINLFAILIGSYIFTTLSDKIKEYKLILVSMTILFVGSILYFVSLRVPTLYSFLFFIFLSFILNVLCGIIYPAATYKCLQIGKSKASSSAIMNTFKIGMPTIAIFLVGNYSQNPLINLALTISLFSLLFIFLLLALFLINRPQMKAATIQIR